MALFSLLFPLTLLLGLCLPPVASAGAQALAPPVIAVVDLDPILNESLAAQALRQQIQQRQTTVSSEFQQRQAALRDEFQQLQQQRSILAADELTRRENELRERMRQMDSDLQERERSLREAFDKAMGTLRKEVLEVVAGIAKERGISIVLSRQQVMLAERSLEITKDVMTRLNEALPTLILEVPSP